MSGLSTFKAYKSKTVVLFTAIMNRMIRSECTTLPKVLLITAIQFES